MYHSDPYQIVIPIQVPEANSFDASICSQYCEGDTEGIERPKLDDGRHGDCVKAIAVDQWMDLPEGTSRRYIDPQEE